YKCSKCSTDCSTTSVKWQRVISEHCADCGSSDYFVETFANPVAAANWSTVTATDTSYVQKTGDYQVFTVKKDQIYRWAMCSNDFDTQVTLFRGAGIEGDCGTFLAYSDDADFGICGSGIGSVIEWKSDFDGEVTLLVNEYSCKQCSKSSSTIDPFTHCADDSFDLMWQRYDCNTYAYNKDISMS
ncbi:MAG TPA: hypothetical protein PLZ43_15760, partial [bacterium]|nr:hypothetical protein [bacterium]